MEQEDLDKTTKQLTLMQIITWAVGTLGAGTALFYALGFSIVNTYVRRVGLEGMFWLTKEFYVDAGANFLLDMIRTPLLAPQLFFIYLFLLSLLVPKEKNLFIFKPTKNGDQSHTGAAFKRKQWIKLSIMFSLIIGTFVFTTFYNYVQKNSLFLFVVRIANFFDADKALVSSLLTTRETSLAFFSAVTPLVIIFGGFFYRFRGVFGERTRSRLYYQSAFIVYAVFLASIPISYANHLYDWKLVPLKDPQIVEHIINQEADQTLAEIDISSDQEPFESNWNTTHIWLLGQSDKQYFFLTKSGVYGRGVIEVIDASKIQHLNFAYDPNQGDFFSTQFEPSESQAGALEESPFEYLERMRNLK